MRGVIVPFWTRFSKASVEDMLPTAYVDARTTKFFLRVFSRGPISRRSRHCLEGSDGTDVPVRNGSIARDIPLASGRWLACCFCFVSVS